MEETTKSQRIELFLVVGLATLYVARQLIYQVERFEDLYASAVASQDGVTNRIIQQLGAYDHTLNNNVPLIGGVLLVLMAWFVFHRQAYPLLQRRINDQQGWLLASVSMALLLAAALVYHYLKLQVVERHDDAGAVIGLRVYSLYRKRTVLADAIGLCILVGTYELTFQFYRYLNRTALSPSAAQYAALVNFLLAVPWLGIAILAYGSSIPDTLWQGYLRDILLLLGLGVQLALLQQYAHNLLVKKRLQTRGWLLTSRLGIYVLTVFLANTLLWGAATRFSFWSWGTVLPLSAVVLVGSVGIAGMRQVLTREKTILQTQVSVGSAELAGLRAQINPHFLFNALNSLYATALKEKSEQTADGIQKLGDMMRFMLHENHRDRIPLDKEIEYLRNYIAIQRMRLDESHDIAIRVTIQEPNRPIYLAPMLLTPFVENAFKHGISLRQPSWITVTLTLDDSRLYFKVHNSRHAKSGTDPEADQSGVGLANVQKRLELLYPDRHQLLIQQSEQDYFVALTLTY